jgi:hypothetical protein
VVHGHTPDISSIATFNFYEPVWYYDQIAKYPQPKRKLARWLGEAHNVGQAMCYWVLPKSGVPIARSTVQELPKELYTTEDFKEELKTLDTALTSMLKSWTQKHPSMNLGNLRLKCQKQMNGSLMHMINISLHR